MNLTNPLRFTDISPLILAAHRDNYGKDGGIEEEIFSLLSSNKNEKIATNEISLAFFTEIIKILLDRGSTLPLPHDVR